jgi:hypothetical protein
MREKSQKEVYQELSRIFLDNVLPYEAHRYFSGQITEYMRQGNKHPDAVLMALDDLKLMYKIGGKDE